MSTNAVLRLIALLAFVIAIELFWLTLMVGCWYFATPFPVRQ